MYSYQAISTVSLPINKRRPVISQPRYMSFNRPMSSVSMHLEPAPAAGASGDQGGGGVMATGGTQDLTLPYNTTSEGDFDAFVPVLSNGLTAGNATQQIQKLNVYATGATLGNATAYLVPPTDLTIVNDIDDILRITKIYQPKEGLLKVSHAPTFLV